MTLDYRSPGVGQHRLQRILSELNTTQTLGTAALIGKALLGIPLCLVGPLLVNAIIRWFARSFTSDALPPAWATFVVAAIGVIPLLLWLERRSRGEFVSDALQGESSPWAASSRGEWEMQQAKLAWVLYTEVALLGPRLIWNVVDTISGRAKSDLPLRVVASEIVLEMLAIDEGISPRQLVRSNRPASQVVAALNLLRQCDWIGMSRQRDRIWLSSAIRQKFERIGLTAG
jgi:hypothetical protein